MEKLQKDRLFTSSFNFASIGNFLLFLGFYQLMPVLPVYLMEVFHASTVEVGIVLSSYIAAALLVRPFSGFLADRFNRKTFYLIGFGLFSLTFVAYPLIKVLALFIVLRMVHGVFFGMVTTTGITLIVDIMPASRRGEGLGYYGIANNLSMAIGPMVGLMMLDSGQSYNLLFYSALICCFLGFICVLQIKAPAKPKAVSEPLSFDRFFLKKGLPAGGSLLLMGIPYGITTSYLALYAKTLNIVSTGLFFTLMAVGLILSRTFSGKMIDRGLLTRVILLGQLILMVTFLLFGLTGFLPGTYSSLISFCFFAVATLMGLGYGMIFPAYNSLFVDLAPHNRRATASSTYLTSWDTGIGVGLIFGGTLSNFYGFPFTYLLVSVLIVVSTLWFKIKAAPHYQRNKRRL